MRPWTNTIWSIVLLNSSVVPGRKPCQLRWDSKLDVTGRAVSFYSSGSQTTPRAKFFTNRDPVVHAITKRAQYGAVQHPVIEAVQPAWFVDVLNNHWMPLSIFRYAEKRLWVPSCKKNEWCGLRQLRQKSTRKLHDTLDLAGGEYYVLTEHESETDRI